MFVCQLIHSGLNFSTFSRSPNGIVFPSKTLTMHYKESNISQAKHGHLSNNQPDFSFFSWIGTVAPAFPVSAHKIKLLSEPDEFYQTLMQKSSTAQHRIVVSSLYLGTGHLEKSLVSLMLPSRFAEYHVFSNHYVFKVESIRRRMIERQGQIKVTFLLDHCRGSRGNINSRSMVVPLLEEQPDSVQVKVLFSCEILFLCNFNIMA